MVEATQKIDGVTLLDCPSCSFKNPEDSRFCNKCGDKLNVEKFAQQEADLEIMSDTNKA